MITIGGFLIDAEILIDPTHTAEPTLHPVEDGADISDHVIRRPLVVNINGLVSDTPIGEAANAREGRYLPSSEAYAILSGHLRDANLVSIRSSVYPTFSNMVCVMLSGPKDARTGDAFAFRATYQQMRLVNVQSEDEITIVEIPRLEKKKRKGPAPSETKDAAEVKPPKAAGPDQTAAAALLERLADWTQ